MAEQFVHFIRDAVGASRNRMEAQDKNLVSLIKDTFAGVANTFVRLLSKARSASKSNALEHEEEHTLKIPVFGLPGSGKTSVIEAVLALQKKYSVVGFSDARRGNCSRRPRSYLDDCELNLTTHVEHFRAEDVSSVLSEGCPSIASFSDEDDQFEDFISSKKMNISDDNTSYDSGFEDMISAASRNSLDTKRPSCKISFWDFSGNESPTFLEHFFVASGTVLNTCLFVVDINQDLFEEVPNPDISHPNEQNVKTRTRLDIIKLSFERIRTYCQGEDGKLSRIILVGTHKDQMSGSELDRHDKATSYFQTIVQSLQDNADDFIVVGNGDFEELNIQTSFIVCATSMTDQGIQHLLTELCRAAYECIGATYVRSDSWCLLRKYLQFLRNEGKQVVGFEELRRFKTKLNSVPISCDIENQDLRNFLNHFHNLGQIIYFEDCQDNVIVLNPEWLFNVFNSVQSHEFATRSSDDQHSEKWFRDFEKSGILHSDLLDVILQKPKFSSEKNVLINIMERLNIIGRPMACAEEATDSTVRSLPTKSHYIVPSMVKRVAEELNMIEVKTSPYTPYTNAPTLCFLFPKAFQVDAYFYRLVCECMKVWPLAMVGENPEVAKNFVVFLPTHNPLLRLVMKASDNVIKLRAINYTFTDTNIPSEVCQRIRISVEEALVRVLGLYRRIIPFEYASQCTQGHLQQLRGEDTDDRPCTIIEPGKDAHLVRRRKIFRVWFGEKRAPLPEGTNSNARSLTEKDLGRIAKRIGKEMNFLALELGVPQNKIDQIKQDFPSHSEYQNYQMLLYWNKVSIQPKMEELKSAMVAADIDPSFVDNIVKCC